MEIHVSSESTVRELRRQVAAAYSIPDEDSVIMAHKIDNVISPSVEILELDKNDIELSTFFGRVTHVSSTKAIFEKKIMKFFYSVIANHKLKG